MKFNIKETLDGYIRVLKISSKPDFEEYSESAKVCLIGILVVGVIGFVVYLVSTAVL
jgi:protein transport protein SEC61 subunit gamma and related proteins